MESEELLAKIVRLAHLNDFESVATLAKQVGFEAVSKLAGESSRKVCAIARGLDGEDRDTLVKAIAVLEHNVGGLGSVTMLKGLLSTTPDQNGELLDWILRNTSSYWYYAQGARSLAEFESRRRWKAYNTALRIKKDQERQAADKRRIADKAT